MNINTKTLTINYDQLEDMIVAHLYSIGAIDDNIDVLSLDLDLPLNEDGFVEFDIDYVELRRGSTPKLTLITGGNSTSVEINA
jgi:hypothetical protein